MFTGIVEELGKVTHVSQRGHNAVLAVEADKVVEDARIGDSIAVNGTCLTVVKIGPRSLTFDVMPETSRISNIGILRVGEQVNLERSLKAGDRISGHFVTGHVDCVGIIRKKFYFRDNFCYEIAVPAGFRGYSVPKGSIAVDGISLTVADIKSDIIRVYIIPHTLKNTTLSVKGPASKVNIEFDILTKQTSRS